MDDAALEAAMLTADLNNDVDGDRAFVAAQAGARLSGYSGEIQGPAHWTARGDRVAPVEVFSEGRRVDGFIRWLDD